MKGISTNPRVLLCTVYRRSAGDYPDIVGIRMDGYKFPKATAPRRVSPGLRFIKQNVPQVNILEYPLWHEYVAELKKGWDVVGFSFFQIELTEIHRMIDEARRQGIAEIWAGGYGALDFDIPSLVDRVFTGPGEDQVARVFGYRVPDDEIRHPPLLVHFSLFAGVPLFTFGILFTSHGCPFNCSFCQTSAYEKRRFKLNIEHIERVIAYYHRIGIQELVILDEIFGIYPEFADRLTRLFARYKMRWMAQTRAGIILRNLDRWYERGLRRTLIGVESMTQSCLDSINKQQKVDEIYEFARRTAEKPGLFRIITFMMGYEHMSLEETVEDVMHLRRLNFESNGAAVLTPFPRTKLWAELQDKYGIFERNHRKYDIKHLVWNHPYISPIQMEYLVKSMRSILNRPFELYRRGLKRLIIDDLKKHGVNYLWNNLLKGPLTAVHIDDRKPVYL